MGNVKKLLLVMLLLCTVAAASAWALVCDFKQSSNNQTCPNNPSGVCGLGNTYWISSIIQSSNSVYFEGMCVFQRAVFTDIPATASDIHSLSISHQATKAGIHAYDFLTSWPQAVEDNEPRLTAYSVSQGGGPITVFVNRCGPDIGPPGSLGATCEALHTGPPGPYFIDVSVPDDTYLSKDGSTAARIAAYEAEHGNRTVRIYASQPISGGSMTVCHDVAAGADTGDSFAHYVLTWTSSADQIVVELAGHLGVGGDGTGETWGAGLGSSSISGGPYHFKLGQLGGIITDSSVCPATLDQVSSLGSQDNQIKGADIQIPCPSCTVSGPTSVCPGSTNTYTVTLTGTCTTPETITWSVTGDATISGPSNASSVSVIAGSTCGSYTVTATLTCGNCGTPPTCSLPVSIVDTTPPVLSGCPSDTTVQCYADVPGRANVTATDNCDGPITPVFSETQSNPGSSCNNVITRTWTATDACGNSASCSQTIAVEDNTPPVISCPAVTSPIECPATPVFPAATATDLCDPDPVITFSDSRTPGACPQEYSVTRTWTATDACGNSASCSQTIAVEDNTPPVISCPANVTLECPANTDPSNTGSATATDTCDASPTITYSDRTVAGECAGAEVITRTWTATDDCGNSASCVQTITVTCPCGGKLTPTGTTCSDFTSGTAEDLTLLCYGVKSGRVSNVAPGVFFYYSAITAPSASFTVTVVQTKNNATFPFFGVQRTSGKAQAWLYDAFCNKLSIVGSDSPTTGVVTYNITGATPGAEYVISIKYSGQRIIGTSVGSPLPTVHYGFKTMLGASVVDQDPDGLDLAPCLGSSTSTFFFLR